MTIDQKMHDHVLAWVAQNPGKGCSKNTGKSGLVAKFKRHYGSTMTDKAISDQIGLLVRKHRPSIHPQKTSRGLAAPNVGGPTSKAPSEVKKSNSKHNPKRDPKYNLKYNLKHNLVNGPIYREKSRIKKEREIFGGNTFDAFSLLSKLNFNMDN
jgi:hypothetical protein